MALLRTEILLSGHAHTNMHMQPLETGIWDPQGQVLRAAKGVCKRSRHSHHIPHILRLQVHVKGK